MSCSHTYLEVLFKIYWKENLEERVLKISSNFKQSSVAH